jgi:hypothetical protein
VIGPFDLIGELTGSPDEQTDLATLHRPCMIHPQPDNKLLLRDMTRGSPVIQGDSLTINMRSVLWIGEPTNAIRSAYQAQRAGLLVPGRANNNVPVERSMQ